MHRQTLQISRGWTLQIENADRKHRQVLKTEFKMKPMKKMRSTFKFEIQKWVFGSVVLALSLGFSCAASSETNSPDKKIPTKPGYETLELPGVKPLTDEIRKGGKVEAVKERSVNVACKNRDGQTIQNHEPGYDSCVRELGNAKFDDSTVKRDTKGQPQMQIHYNGQ